MQYITNYIPWIEILRSEKSLKTILTMTNTMFNNACYEAINWYRNNYKYLPYAKDVCYTSSGTYMVEVLFDKQPEHCLKVEDVIVTLLEYRKEPKVLFNSTEYR